MHAGLAGRITRREGRHRRYDAFVDALDADLVAWARHEGQARRLVERLALATSASLLLRHAPHFMADAFVAMRLAGSWAGHFGDVPLGIDAGAIARSAIPDSA